MELRKLYFVSALVMVLFLISISAATSEADENDVRMDDLSEFRSPETKQFFEFDEAEGRFLLQRKRTRRITCNKLPRICHARGSPGPLCCKKKCVNILMDRMNCGKCGKKCKYNEICCGGKCVNPSFNRKHCGGCNNRCSNGEFCVFGLCNYA